MSSRGADAFFRQLGAEAVIIVAGEKCSLSCFVFVLASLTRCRINMNKQYSTLHVLRRGALDCLATLGPFGRSGWVATRPILARWCLHLFQGCWAFLLCGVSTSHLEGRFPLLAEFPAVT